jgi:hypothetical protein
VAKGPTAVEEVEGVEDSPELQAVEVVMAAMV